MAALNLHQIFSPRSIAVIGASSHVGHVGNDIVKNLQQQGFAGKIFPVNPNAVRVNSLLCYPRISAIQEPVDLAIVAVKAPIVSDVVKDIGIKGTKAVIVISAGFKETGREGELLERELVALCKKYYLTLIGPNCLGVINPEISMNASFSSNIPHSGPIAFISQSGALCSTVIDYAQYLGIGFSKFISIGNKACVDETDILLFLANDQSTKVIMMYAEEIKYADAFMQAARMVTRGARPKPIIMLKAGRSAEGTKASASHTGAMGGVDAYYDALFSQCGIIRAQTLSEFFDFVVVCAHNTIPSGNTVAIVTNAGGPAVITSDTLSSSGLKLASLAPKTVTNIRNIIPQYKHSSALIDVLGDAPPLRFEQALSAVGDDPNVESILTILTPQTMTDIEGTARVIARVKKDLGKPLVVSFMGEETVRPGVTMLHTENVAVVSYPDNAATALGKFAWFGRWTKQYHGGIHTLNGIKTKAAYEMLDEVHRHSESSPSPAELYSILDAYGFPVVKNRVVRSASDAAVAAPLIGNRIAMKIISPDIIHKTDVDGIKLNVTPSDAPKVYNDMMAAVHGKKPHARLNGILLAQMEPVENGVELIIGAKREENFGTMVMVGFGGIYVEVFQDVAWGVAPLTVFDAKGMVERTIFSKILLGFRGKPALDTRALIESICRVSQFVTDFPQILELDINPYLLLPAGSGGIILDARMNIAKDRYNGSDEKSSTL